MQQITIGSRHIGAGNPPYIIAEMSANHGGDKARAMRIIDVAAHAGADAIKFQAYTPDSMTLDVALPGFVIEADNPWKGRRLYELYAEASTPYDWFPELFQHAREKGIEPFATPFDIEAVRMLEGLNARAYKIASFEAIDLDLIHACASTGKPLIISTGLCSSEEISLSIETARAAGASQIVVLKCNSAYPANPEEANLLTIPDMAEKFGVPIGYSDHTLGVAVAVSACALGACVVEKHVIDARTPKTADSEFSALPHELERLVLECRQAHQARGDVKYGPTQREIGSLVFRRSLYATADIAAGETFSARNVRAIRPGFGLHPKEGPRVMGRKAARLIRRGEPVSWDQVE